MEPLSLTLLLAASAGLFAVGFGALAWTLQARRHQGSVHRRFVRLVHGELANPEDAVGGDIRSLVQRLGAWRVERASSRSLDPEVPVLLARAGWRGGEALAAFTGLQILLPCAAVGAVALAWMLGWHPSGVALLCAGFGAGAVGYLAPKMVLRSIAGGRRKRLSEDVMVFTQLLRVLFEAGLSIEQSLGVMAQENRRVLPDFAHELDTVSRRLSAGEELTTCLAELASELDVEELTDMVSLLRGIARYGGSVQAPLAEFADLLADRRRTKLQEAVSKLSAKMTVVMIAFLFPALLAFVAGPGFLALIRALRGMN